MCASLWASKPTGAVKAKACVGRPRGDPIACLVQRRRIPGAFATIPACRGTGRRTESVHAGTRKMVTYARPGRSQGKLWWRSAAILTCKSIV